MLAYFFLLAVFPAAIVALSLIPYLSIPHLQQGILDLLHQILPEQSANFIQETVRYVASKGREGLLTFGLMFTLWSASTGMYAVMEQLNVVYDVKDRRPFWKARGTAIVLMMFFVLLAIGCISLVIFGGTVQSWLASRLGWSRPLLLFFATLRWIIIAAGLLLALAVSDRFGPDVKHKFRFISAGNVTAATLIAVVSFGFQFLRVPLRQLQCHIWQSRGHDHPDAVDIYGRRGRAGGSRAPEAAERQQARPSIASA